MLRLRLFVDPRRFTGIGSSELACRKTSQLRPRTSKMEEGGYIPVYRFFLLWSFYVWIIFCFLLIVHTSFAVSSEEYSEPSEESGEQEAGE